MGSGKKGRFQSLYAKRPPMGAQKRKELGSALFSGVPPLPSPRRSLTSGFGMEPGVPSAPSPPNSFLLRLPPFENRISDMPFPIAESLYAPDQRCDENLSTSSIWYHNQTMESSPRAISTGQLSASRRLHFRPIDPLTSGGPYSFPMGGLISRLASRLYAFSAYPLPGQLPGRAAGATTGVPLPG